MVVFGFGFTGTQAGMTVAQRNTVFTTMVEAVGEFGREGVEARHGDCVGADRDFHLICKGLGLWIVGYPPIREDRRAWCDFNEERAPREYLDRNKDIVNQSNVLVACPRSAAEELRSGTWSTVRYARKVGVPVLLVLPSGDIERTGLSGPLQSPALLVQRRCERWLT